MSESTDRLLLRMKAIVEDVESSRLAIRNCPNASDRKRYQYFVESELHEEQSVYFATRKSLRREAKKAGIPVDAEIAKLDKRIHTARTAYYPSIVLGQHASSFVRWANQEHGTIEFQLADGETSPMIFKIPRRADKAWGVLKKLLETTSADGYVELDAGWGGMFSRNDKDSDLQRIIRHIVPEQRGHTGSGRFRLEREEKPRNEPV